MGNTYLWLKSLHLLGVVVFLGNIVITGWWKFMADRTLNPQIIAFAQRQVTLTDFVFTAGGAALLLAAGWGNAALHGMDIFNIRWLSWGFWLFNASGLIWVAILIPVQIKQAGMAKSFEHETVIPQEYWTLGKRWYVWGTIATLLPLCNLYWMVFKPT
jgi:uncharacterized membrane protein